MKNESTNHTSIEYKMILIGIGLGALYWIFESVIMASVFHQAIFIQQIFVPQLHEMWMRLTVVCILIGFGVYAQVVIGQRKKTEAALRKTRGELETRVKKRTRDLAKANEELRNEITERKKVENRIKRSLQEKEVLLREIHHRVKNNLQVISSLLNLQGRYTKSKQALEMFKESQNRIKSMALVHERLYQSRDLARIDFAEYIRRLADHLFDSYRVNRKAIILKINIDDVFLGIDKAIPCGLIINELVSNSLKHAFPTDREGEIRIDLASDDDKEFTLIVSDDGVGFPKDLDFRNTASLGLQLVCTLTDQVGGTLELDRSGRTKFGIVFSESI